VIIYSGDLPLKRQLNALKIVQVGRERKHNNSDSDLPDFRQRRICVCVSWL